MAKLKIVQYKCGSVFGVSNNNFNLLTCEYKIVIPLTLQKYVLNWYHTYLLHPVLDRMKATIYGIFTCPS